MAKATVYTLVTPQAAWPLQLRACRRAGLALLSEDSWGLYQEYRVRLEPRGRLADSLAALLSGRYQFHLDLTHRTATARKLGSLETYEVRFDAPVGARCTCESERFRSYAPGRTACKHYLATARLLVNLGLIARPEAYQLRRAA